MKSLFDQTTRESVLNRFDKLTEQTERKWGKLTPAQLLAHLNDTFEVTFAEREIKAPSGFTTSAFFRWMIIDAPMPWPKGSRSHPEFFKHDPTVFAADKNRSRKYLERFAVGAAQKFGPSPLLGNLAPDQWARLNYRHVDHHLRQYGL